MRPYRGRRTVDIRDPILEPFWTGARVLAHIGGAEAGGAGAQARAAGAAGPSDVGRPSTVRLIEVLGADVAPELPELAAAVGGAVLAQDAIVDGIISRQVGLSGVGASPVTEVHHRPSLILRDRSQLDVIARGADGATDELADGFIAVDLLRVDGTSLLDVPLLERKRLLESVVAPGRLVRLSPVVRPPVDGWIATWKSVGLRGGMLKAANSRYELGAESIAWRVVERLGQRR
jgi:hypothetical protein